MGRQLLYRELAKYYDKIYHWKDYKKESEKLIRLISKYKKSKGNTLLELGCGTAHHMKYFKKNFKCVGIDINEHILKIARKKHKGIIFKKADMIKLNLNRKFDIIISLFSSIGYVKTYSNLKKTIFNIADHLVKGGVVIIEPWFTKKTFKSGSKHMTTYEDDKIAIARLNVSRIKGNLSKFDMHYLIAEKNKDVKYFVDSHEMGLFDTNKTLKYIKDAGLKAKFLKKGFMKDRGVFVGVK